MTTGLRFHPIEILLSMVIKLAVVAALGAPAVPLALLDPLHRRADDAGIRAGHLVQKQALSRR